MNKQLFVDKLCEICNEGLSKENIRSGFKAIGIFPLDCTKYPQRQLDSNKLDRYDRWVANGKDPETQHQLAISVSTPKKLRPSTQPLGDSEQTGVYCGTCYCIFR